MNASKSTHMIFTTWNVAETQIVIDNESILITNKMTLKTRVTVNRKQTVPYLQKINWLLSYKSALTLNSKILLYKVAAILISIYGIQLLGCAKKYNFDIIQRSQNKVLREVAATPWCISETLHKELRIKYVRDYTLNSMPNHNSRQQQHPKKLVIKLINTEDNTR